MTNLRIRGACVSPRIPRKGKYSAAAIRDYIAKHPKASDGAVALALGLWSCDVRDLRARDARRVEREAAARGMRRAA